MYNSFNIESYYFLKLKGLSIYTFIYVSIYVYIKLIKLYIQQIKIKLLIKNEQTKPTIEIKKFYIYH